MLNMNENRKLYKNCTYLQKLLHNYAHEQTQYYHKVNTKNSCSNKKPFSINTIELDFPRAHIDSSMQIKLTKCVQPQVYSVKIELILAYLIIYFGFYSVNSADTQFIHMTLKVTIRDVLKVRINDVPDIRTYPCPLLFTRIFYGPFAGEYRIK